MPMPGPVVHCHADECHRRLLGAAELQTACASASEQLAADQHPGQADLQAVLLKAAESLSEPRVSSVVVLRTLITDLAELEAEQHRRISAALARHVPAHSGRGLSRNCTECGFRSPCPTVVILTGGET
jgi:hypothetical protein